MSCSGYEPFHKKPLAVPIDPGTAVAEFLIFDDHFPRSVHHCLSSECRRCHRLDIAGRPAGRRRPTPAGCGSIADLAPLARRPRHPGRDPRGRPARIPHARGGQHPRHRRTPSTSHVTSPGRGPPAADVANAVADPGREEPDRTNRTDPQGAGSSSNSTRPAPRGSAWLESFKEHGHPRRAPPRHPKYHYDRPVTFGPHVDPPAAGPARPHHRSTATRSPSNPGRTS